VRARLRPPVAFQQGIVNLLPQFAPRHEAMFASVLLSATLAAVTLVWLIVNALAVSAVGSFLHRRHVRRAMEGATGAALIGLGVGLALEARR
jgi:threonine/homoserine/homoserine lactone efflux protein